MLLLWTPEAIAEIRDELHVDHCQTALSGELPWICDTASGADNARHIKEVTKTHVCYTECSRFLRALPWFSGTEKLFRGTYIKTIW
jgi:hypothetical protein